MDVALCQDRPDAIMLVMGAMIVLRAEVLAVEDCIAYDAWSPKFREVAVGEMIPEYTFTVTDNNGVLSVQFNEKGVR
jgi:hypothetical protein